TTRPRADRPGRANAPGRFGPDRLSAACSGQCGAMAQVVIDPHLPVPHELAIEPFGERGDEIVASRAKTRVRVSDVRLAPARHRANLDGQFAGSDPRRDLEHFDEAGGWFVTRDVPDRVSRLGRSSEDAIRLGEAGCG